MNKSELNGKNQYKMLCASILKSILLLPFVITNQMYKNVLYK